MEQQADIRTLKQYYRSQLLTGALVFGVAMVVILLLEYVFSSVPTVQKILGYVGGLVVVIAVLVVYGKRVAARYAQARPAEGFSYGRVFGFSVLMSMLAGVICGVGYYLLTEVIDPAHFAAEREKAMTEAVETLRQNPQITEEMIEQQVSMSNYISGMMQTLGGSIGFNVFGMLLWGGFVALFTSAGVRRKPELIARDVQDTQEQTQQ